MARVTSLLGKLGALLLVAVVVVLVGTAVFGNWMFGVLDDRPPPSFTATWHGPDGQPAERGTGRDRAFEVASNTGPEHCDWHTVVFLRVAWPLGTTYTIDDSPPLREYVRDPRNALEGAAELAGTFDDEAVLPAGAQSTGYRTSSGVELWFGPDGGGMYAYLVTDDRVERWPRAVESIGCV